MPWNTLCACIFCRVWPWTLWVGHSILQIRPDAHRHQNRRQLLPRPHLQSVSKQSQFMSQIISRTIQSSLCVCVVSLQCAPPVLKRPLSAWRVKCWQWTSTPLTDAAPPTSVVRQHTHTHTHLYSFHCISVCRVLDLKTSVFLACLCVCV